MGRPVRECSTREYEQRRLSRDVFSSCRVDRTANNGSRGGRLMRPEHRLHRWFARNWVWRLYSQTETARRYGISLSAVNDIKQGRTWAHSRSPGRHPDASEASVRG